MNRHLTDTHTAYQHVRHLSKCGAHFGQDEASGLTFPALGYRLPPKIADTVAAR